MKKYYFLIFTISLFLFSCKKELKEEAELSQMEQITERAKSYLKKEIPPQQFDALEWNKITVYEKTGSPALLAIPILNNRRNEFAYIHVHNNSFTGNWVKMQKSSTTKRFESIIATSFQGNTIKTTVINEHGYIASSIVQNINLNSSSTYRSAAGSTSFVSMALVRFQIGLTWSDLLLIETVLLRPELYIGTPLGETAEYIVPAGSDENTSSAGVPYIYEIEVDESEALPAEDIAKIFNCFDQVPNPGAVYSVKLCNDVPVNSFPSAALDYTGSVGHTFIVLSKSNGSNTVTKAFGFYPQQGKKVLGLDPVPSKIANDFLQEINSSLEMPNISELAFNTIKNKAIMLAGKPYDLDDYNCTDYAIDVFNSIRGGFEITVEPQALTIQGPNLPLTSVLIKKSPQKLFKEMETIKYYNGLEAAHSIIQLDRNYKSPNTTGGCN